MPDDLLLSSMGISGGKTLPTYSVISSGLKQHACMPLLNTKLSSVTPSHFLLNLSSLQHMHQSSLSLVAVSSCSKFKTVSIKLISGLLCVMRTTLFY
jgi:hypothetical protein